MSTELTAEGIRRFPFFAALSEADAAIAAGTFTLYKVAAGDRVFNRGDEADSVYLLAVGEVEILFGRGNGVGEHSIRVPAPSIIGEMGVLLSRPRSAAVRARTDAELWRLCRFALDAALERGERWAGQFTMATARSLAGRLSAAQEELPALLASLGDGPTPAPASVPDELERLRERLFTEWTF